MTLHLRHNPSNPIGVATWYDVYADVLSNQLGALVSLGGIEQTAAELVLHPELVTTSPIGRRL